MKRAAPLISFSHDHQSTLARAKRLRDAAANDGEARRGEATRFYCYCADEVLAHFRDEEALLYPLAMAGGNDALQTLTQQALGEHAQLRWQLMQLQDVLASGAAPESAAMFELADMVTAHVRFEERTVFPAIERAIDDQELARTLGERVSVHFSTPADGGHNEAAADEGDAERAELVRAARVLAEREITVPGGGVAWRATPGDLNVTLVTWPAGRGVDAHVNNELDVLLVGVDGCVGVTVNDTRQLLRAGDAIVIPRGAERSIEAHGDMAYLSIHRRRDGLRLTSFAQS